MGMTLALGNLVSRAARTNIGSTGLRTFIRSKAGKLSTSSGPGGIVEWVINAALGFGGWLIQGLWNIASKFVSWSLSGLWGLFCQGVMFLWHFNWNQSDAEMDASLQAAWNAFGGTLGGLAGKAAGSLIVLGGSLTLFAFNETLALHVLREVGEEAMDELCSSAVPVIRGAANLAMRWLFNQTYKALRNYIGANPDSFYETDAQLIERQINGEINQAQRQQIQKKRDALKAERKPWSFANKFEEWIESFSDEFVRNFLEEFFEEGFETIQELGYVAFSAVDSHIAAHKMGNKVATGANVTAGVQVQLNRNATTTP